MDRTGWTMSSGVGKVVAVASLASAMALALPPTLQVAQTTGSMAVLGTPTMSTSQQPQWLS